jgi:S1-C subfamily serine protease/adenylate kinase family enzyme
MGGTLIIENPSSMLPQRSDGNSFGPEALGVIAGAMSSYTNEISIVLLDSKEGLERLYRAFPTMRSSISREFHLEELSPAEMEQVFRLKTRDSMVLEPELQDLFSDFMVNWVSDRGGQETAVRTWSNGVEVDRLVDSLAQNWKRLNGTVQSEEIPVEEDGQQRTYRLNRRLITREMVPQELQRYLKRSSAVSETAMEELNQLVGLRRVKEAVRGIERRIRRLGKDRVSPGLYCFLGNPGVGKTTVANLMGGILRATGALSQGHVISRTARQMCESVGEFSAIIKLAKNGILFIDEAHQLAENAYGNEVIKRLLTVLEDTEVTRNTCIILAGYPREMMRMLSMDSGLSSRFGTADSMIFFDDYIPEELILIMQGMAAHANTIPQIGSLTPLRLTEEYRECSLEVFQRVCQQGDPDFGNARFVRNYLHDSLDELLRRLDETEAAGNTAEEDLLTGSDVPVRYRGLLNRKISQVQLAARDLNTQRQERIRAEDYDEACDRLARSVVYLSVETASGSTGSGTGTIISQNGYVLTCNHVAEGAKRIRARLYTPGMVGGNYHWFDCEVLRPSFKDCDMSILKLEGTGFPAAPIRPATEPVRRAEETLMIGYPLGEMLTRDNVEALNYSNFSGRVASIQPVGTRGVETCYVDTTGLHGNSGSPVFSREDGRMIGVFSGSIIPPGKKTLDEINYFYPIRYLWERFVELQTPQDGTEDDE